MKNRTRVILIIFIIVLFGFFLIGRKIQVRPENDKPTIALVMKSLANEFFLTMESGAEEHNRLNSSRYNLLTYGIKDERGVSQQIHIIEQLMARNVDAIIIAPADSKALIPVCQLALKNGIVVINIDNKFDSSVLNEKELKIPFVGPDNHLGARMAGDYLAGFLKPGDQVAIIEGIPTAFNSQERILGFKEAMNAAGISIVDLKTGLWEMDKAYDVALSIINEHSEVKALLCANDSMALGAAAAVKAASKTGLIKIIGFDNISAVNEQLKKGYILATIDQHADRIAIDGIELALEQLRTGNPVLDKITPVNLVTGDD